MNSLTDVRVQNSLTQTLGCLKMPGAKHTILGGNVYVCRRVRSRFWQCSTVLTGKKASNWQKNSLRTGT
jgi:hypothetical protein